MTRARPPGESERRPARNGAAASQGGTEEPTVTAASSDASLIRGLEPDLAQSLAAAVDSELAARPHLGSMIARDAARISEAIRRGRAWPSWRRTTGCTCGCLSKPPYFDDPACVRRIDPAVLYRDKMSELRTLDGRIA